jgi:hypothetical protein
MDMKAPRLALALTVANLALLMFVLIRLLPPSANAMSQGLAEAQVEAAPVLRGRALELFDEEDRVRARINVEPDGEVILRLLDENGTIRVKLGAGESGSGLLLLDETTEPGVQIIARRTGSVATPTTTSMTLQGADGRRRVITP